jgi:hypothetical protein
MNNPKQSLTTELPTKQKFVKQMTSKSSGYRSEGSVFLKAACAITMFAFVTFFSNGAHAQLLSHGDLFGPGAPPPMVGVELGFGNHQQQGMFQAACKCEFDQGTGTGFMGSLMFELPLSYEWVVGFKGGIDFKNTTGTVAVNDVATIQFQKNDSVATGVIGFNRIGVNKITYLSLTPFVQYQFFRLGPFVQVGVDVELAMSSHFTHTRELTTSNVTEYDANGNVVGTLNNVRFTNGTMDETLQDGTITDLNSLQLGALLTVGYDISLNERSVVAPMISYEFPFTLMRANGDLANNWKISTLYASIGLKYKLN